MLGRLFGWRLETLWYLPIVGYGLREEGWYLSGFTPSSDSFLSGGGCFISSFSQGSQSCGGLINMCTAGFPEMLYHLGILVRLLMLNPKLPPRVALRSRADAQITHGKGNA